MPGIPPFLCGLGWRGGWHLAPVLSPASLAVRTSALSDHRLVSAVAWGSCHHPPPPVAHPCSWHPLPRAKEPFWGAAAVQEGENCLLFIWLQLQNLRQAVGPKPPCYLESKSQTYAGGGQMCLLICTHRLLAAEEGWEQSTSSRDSSRLPPAPTKAPVGWGHDVPQLLHVGLMGHCSSQRRLSLPTWCKQRQLNKGRAEASGHTACAQVTYISCCLALCHCAKFLLPKGSILPGDCFLNSTFENHQSRQGTVTPAS